MRVLTRALVVVGIVATTLTAAGCSSPSSSDGSDELFPLIFQLNNPVNGVHAGFAAAVEEGFYTDAGLDVTLNPGGGSSLTAQMVASGVAKVGYADATATTQLIAQGAKMQILSTIYQSNPNEVIAFADSGINSIADLKGKTVGVPSPSSQTTMLPLFLEANGLTTDDLTLVNMAPTSLVQALLQNQVDAILGSTETYQVQLEDQTDRKLFTAMFSTNGVPTVSASIFAQTEYAEANPEVLAAFVKASLKGWEFASQNPDKAIDDVNTLAGAAADPLSAGEFQAILDGDLLCTGGAKFVGKAEPEQWVKTQDLLSSVALLPEGTDPTIYYTYKYLPADADLQACPIK